MKPATLTVPSVVGLVTVAAVVANVIVPGYHVWITAAAAVAIILAGLGYFLYTLATGKGTVKDRLLEAVQGMLEAAQQIIAVLPMASKMSALEAKLVAVETELNALKAQQAPPAS